MEVKETVRTLLDHGSDFINTDCEMPLSSFLPYLLRSKRWTLESVRLLIRRGADPGIYVPPWGCCLPLAIYGSSMESLEGLRDTLILLIMNGADVHARDSNRRSVTEIANYVDTRLYYDDGPHVNSDLRLKDIWTEALAACGYDAEEVNYRSLHAVEVSESDGDRSDDEDDYDSEDEDEDEDDYGISEAEDEDNVITHRDDVSIIQIQGPESSLDSPKDCFNCETWNPREESTDDDPREQAGPADQCHFDWSLLEDDTNVWTT